MYLNKILTDKIPHKNNAGQKKCTPAPWNYYTTAKYTTAGTTSPARRVTAFLVSGSLKQK